MSSPPGSSPNSIFFYNLLCVLSQMLDARRLLIPIYGRWTPRKGDLETPDAIIDTDTRRLKKFCSDAGRRKLDPQDARRQTYSPLILFRKIPVSPLNFGHSLA